MGSRVSVQHNTTQSRCKDAHKSRCQFADNQPKPLLRLQPTEDERQESEEINALPTRETRSLTLTETCFGGFFLELMPPRQYPHSSFETRSTIHYNDSSECEVTSMMSRNAGHQNVFVINKAVREKGHVKLGYQQLNAPVMAKCPEMELVSSTEANTQLAIFEERGSKEPLVADAIAAACSAPADACTFLTGSEGTLSPISPPALPQIKQLSSYAEEQATCHVESWASLEHWREATMTVQGVEETPGTHVSLRSPRDYYQSMGNIMEQQGRLSEALECYQRCLSLDDELETTIDDSASVYLTMGIVYWKMGSYGESLGVLQFVLSMYEHAVGYSWLENPAKLFGSRAVIAAEVFLIIGRVYLSLGDNPEARSHIKQSLAILENAEIEHTLAKDIFAKALHSLGMTFSACGRDTKAMRYFIEALRIQREMHGGHHVDIAASLTSIGSIQEKNGNFDEAMSSFLESLQIYHSCSAVSSCQVDCGVTLSRVGWIHFINGNYNAAMEAYTESIKILTMFLGSRHRNCASVLVQIGMTHRKCYRFDEALKVYKEALAVQRAALGVHHHDVAITLDEIGATYMSLNNLDSAITSFDQSLRVRRQVQGRKHVDVGMTYTRLGDVYLKIKDKRLAKQCYSNALTILKANKLPSDDNRMQRLSEALRDLNKGMV